jgi:tetratricopeptide (TPR) repeat protein
MPKLEAINLDEDAAIARIARVAVKSLYQAIGLTDGLDVLSAELLLLEASATEKADASRARELLEEARALYERDLNDDSSDVRSFDRLDEILVSLARKTPDPACDGPIAARAVWVDRRPGSQTPSRQLTRLDAQTGLVACLVGAGRNDQARPLLAAASTDLRELNGAGRTARERSRIYDLAAMLGDAYTKLGEREAALSHYGTALVAAELAVGGRAPFSGQVDSYIDLQRRTASLFGQVPVTRETTRAFSGYGQFLRQPVRIDDRSKKKALLEGSIVLLDALYAADPGKPEPGVVLALAHQQLGTVQREDRDQDGAATSFTRALDLLGQVAAKGVLSSDQMHELLYSHEQLTNLLRDVQRNREAVSYLRAKIEFVKSWIVRNPTDLAVQRTLGNSYSGLNSALREVNDYAAAAEVTEEWTRMRPEEARAWNSLCWSRAVAGRAQEAVPSCNKAIELDPEFGAALDSRGFAYLKLGQLDRSIADYDASLRLRPTNEYSLYGRGLAKRRRGDLADGDADIAAAKQRNPRIDEIFASLGVQ